MTQTKIKDDKEETHVAFKVCPSSYLLMKFILQPLFVTFTLAKLSHVPDKVAYTSKICRICFRGFHTLFCLRKNKKLYSYGLNVYD